MIVNLIVPTANTFNINDLPVFSKGKYLLNPFDERVIVFLDAFSKAILKESELNKLPEMVTLAFWIRKTNILKLKSENENLLNNSNFKAKPIGKVFHVCPANVDTMFIYSLAVSLMMGNKNLLRISNRMHSTQITKLFELLSKLLSFESYSTFREYINIITYEHNEAISDYISQNVNARIIWGGDSTINTFRKFVSNPRTKDIVFSDRVSILCINAKEYLNSSVIDKKKFTINFFNDAYIFDQKGCSSPQSIYFIANEVDFIKCIKNIHLDLSKYIEEKLTIDINSIASLKLNKLVNDIFDKNIIKTYGDNFIKFVEVPIDKLSILNHTCGGGYFYISRIDSLSVLEPLVTMKLQTVSYFGLSDFEKSELIRISNSEGIDRIVPLGKALEFSYLWDGYNLFEEVSRKVNIQ
jgi:hypothetical protein